MYLQEQLRILIFFYATFFSVITRFPGRVAQSVTCLATDACLTADPGVASSIPARSPTFVEIAVFPRECVSCVFDAIN